VITGSNHIFASEADLTFGCFYHEEHEGLEGFYFIHFMFFMVIITYPALPQFYLY